MNFPPRFLLIGTAQVLRYDA
ncbi:MAG: hypothetical protein FD119_4106, partial [Stygiobacter sp.]